MWRAWKRSPAGSIDSRWMSAGSASLTARRTSSRRSFPAVLHVRHLRQGVHAGVGAARTGELHLLAGGRLEGLPHLAGHGARVLLFLPPAVAGAFVFDGQAIGGHLDARIAVLWDLLRGSLRFRSSRTSALRRSRRSPPAPSAAPTRRRRASCARANRRSTSTSSTAAWWTSSARLPTVSSPSRSWAAASCSARPASSTRATRSGDVVAHTETSAPRAAIGADARR